MTAEPVEGFLATEAFQRIDPEVGLLETVTEAVSKACMDMNSTTFEEASELLHRVRETRKVLQKLENGFESWLGEIKQDQRIRGTKVVEGVGAVTVRRAAAHTDWDHAGLLVQVMHAHAAKHDGELPDTFEYRDLIEKTAGIGYWRTGELKELGVDVSEYRTVTPGRWTVEIQAGEPSEPATDPAETHQGMADARWCGVRRPPHQVG